MATVPTLSSSFFFLLLLFCPFTSSAPMSESEALLQLKKSFTNAESLASWNPNSPACSGEKSSWVGVVCFKGTVMGLRLAGMSLSGTIDVDALVHLPGLRSVSFSDNAFSGPIPGLGRLSSLKGVYMSGNKFSGEIPPDFFTNMESLKKLWLSGNSFTGPIPASLAKLTHLIEAHLDNNGFSGTIPFADLPPTLKSFNVSNNALEGEIPANMKSFGESSFAGNAGLCGAPLAKQCVGGGGGGAAAAASSTATNSGQEKRGSGKTAMVAVAVVVLVCLLAMAVCSRSRKREREFNKLERNVGEESVEVQVREPNRKEASLRKTSSSVRKESSHSSKRGGGGGAPPKLTMVNEEKGVFGLPDLMKAAAEVLGNGGLGSAYKAVMTNGFAVVVKRMREMNRVGDEGFETEVRRLGMLRHPNVLPPLAFHFRKEEKLLVYEHISRGSLLYNLHGDRAPEHDDLNWPARLNIVRGIARGMAFLHTELASSDLPHGNLKSSNVLLGDDLEPFLIDYGYSPLVTPQQAAQAMVAYKSPESIQYGRVSHKSDVYCFGILILEILTGKFPSQYLSSGKGGTDLVQWVTLATSEQREFELFDPEISGAEDSNQEGMERLLHLGAACADPNPERRPDMQEALRRVEEIAAEEEGVLSKLRSRRVSFGEQDGDHFFAIS